MKKTAYKKVFGLVLTMVILISVMSSLTLTVHAETIASGSCGENATWVLDSEGILTISGTGSTYSFNSLSEDDRNSITSVVVTSGITSIGTNVFNYCNSVTSISIPDSVTSMASVSFYFSALTGILEWYSPFPSSLTNITVDTNNPIYSDKDGVLMNKTETEIIRYPDGREGLYTIPNSVIEIGQGAFSGCTSLSGISIPDNVTSIGRFAFSGCTSLTSVTIPSSVTAIDSFVFYGTGLTSVTFPNALAAIGGSMFRNCKSLTSVTIPDGVTSLGGTTFVGCTSLASISIPDSVTSIGSNTFSGCTSLTSITIPDRVTSIGSEVFYGCTSLTSIIIPDSITSIGYEAFSGCTSLTSITIPDRVISIGSEVFYGCTLLTSVTILNSGTSIGYGAFSDCPSLTIYCYKDSVAHRYAFTNSHPYILLDDNIPDPPQQKYTVTFDSKGGSQVSSLTEITSGSKINKPFDPTWSGYKFIAWCKDSSCTQPWNFNTDTVTKNITLYAKWEKTTPPPPQNIPVTKITISGNPVNLALKKTATLKATVTPSNATNKAITWSSSNTKAVTVNQSGKVTAVGAGKATIKATAKDGSKIYGSVIITVHQYVTMRIGKSTAIMNGTKTSIDSAGTKPSKISGKTMLPLRFVGEKMGGKVKYINDNQPITMSYGNTKVEFRLNNKKMKIITGSSTKTITLDVPAQKVKGKTYIPLRAIGQALGFDIYYQSGTEYIIVSNPKMTNAIRNERLAEAKKVIK